MCRYRRTAILGFVSVAPAYPVWSLLIEARRRAGITQAELAARAGTTQSAISAYEHARKLPSIPVLTRLVEACGFELSLDLVDTADDTAPGHAIAEQSVEARMQSVANATAFVAELRRGLKTGG